MMSFISEFFSFLRARKKYWLVPVLVMFMFFGGIVVLSHGTVFAPLIYTLF